jgi:hypothetical protein
MCLAGVADSQCRIAQRSGFNPLGRDHDPRAAIQKGHARPL